MRFGWADKRCSAFQSLIHEGLTVIEMLRPWNAHSAYLRINSGLKAVAPVGANHELAFAKPPCVMKRQDIRNATLLADSENSRTETLRRMHMNDVRAAGIDHLPKPVCHGRIINLSKSAVFFTYPPSKDMHPSDVITRICTHTTINASACRHNADTHSPVHKPAPKLFGYDCRSSERLRCKIDIRHEQP